MRRENGLPDQLLGLWVLAVVGASPNMGAPWAQEGKYPSWGPGDRSYAGGFRGEIPKGAGGRGTAASWGLPLRRTHFSARMPGARVLLLVQHVTTSVDRRWQRATEQGQG